jgi:flavin-dependent dehydrogenase/tetratricopeptide (TPR) repeat protein
MTTDVLIAGGGVAGSALAIHLGRAGLKVELFERGEFPREKPCGEGLMPAGVAAFERLGLAGAVGGVPLSGVRYHFRGAVAAGPFPRVNGAMTTGRAQRRAVLDRVVFEAAAATRGVVVHTRSAVQGPIVERGRVTGLVVAGSRRYAPLTVAADGVHSPLRRALGLDGAPPRRRVGMRAHYRLAAGVEVDPWVDILIGDGHELYVTPLPHGELLVAALADAQTLGAPAATSFDRWCMAQPLLADRLRGAEPLTPLRGVSPLTARARNGHAPGMVLLGDAAGSLDPITGGGMTHALECAELLARCVPRAIDEGDAWLTRFEARRRALLADYAVVTRGLLWLARHPGWIGPALSALRACPPLLSHLVGVAGGTRSLVGRRWQRALGAAACGVLLMTAGLAGPSHATAPAPAVTALLAMGDSALARFDLDTATVAFTQARRAAPNSYEAAWKLSRALADRATLSPKASVQRPLCQQAESLARAAIAIEPRGAKGHAYLAIALGKLALLEGGKRKVRLAREIKAEADSALALDPHEDLAHHVLGVWNREIVELSGVRRFFATTLYGRLPRASLDEAIEHIRTAAESHPDVIPHRVELGITLASARRYREAEREFERALGMPTTWVTDDVYRAKARDALARVRRKARST